MWEGVALFFIALDLAFSSALYEEIKNEPVKQRFSLKSYIINTPIHTFADVN